MRHLRSLPAIDRIWVTTNAILLDKHGIANVLDSGVSFITISTAGFDEEMYRRVYRNSSYQRMRRNVKEHNVYRWAGNLIAELSDIRVNEPEPALKSNL